MAAGWRRLECRVAELEAPSPPGLLTGTSTASTAGIPGHHHRRPAAGLRHCRPGGARADLNAALVLPPPSGYVREKWPHRWPVVCHPLRRSRARGRTAVMPGARILANVDAVRVKLSVLTCPAVTVAVWVLDV